MTHADVLSDPRFERAVPPALAQSLAIHEAVTHGPRSDPAPCRRPATVVPLPLSRHRIEAALARVLASRAFQHSPRHRNFLRYVVEGTLAGRAQSLKEVVIGIDVFERDIDRFDPRRDSIVRVEARRLRAKLRKYYEAEGRNDAIAIELGIGRYVPTFVERRAPLPPQVVPLLMVLPLRTPSGAGVRGWSNGLADQLVARLGTVDAVRVMAPLAPARLHDPSLMESLRRDHGVDYVIDGSIARAGSRMRCTMFLSQTIDHLCLWSQTSEFDVATADDDPHSDILFRVQDRVADMVAGAVRAVISPH